MLNMEEVDMQTSRLLGIRMRVAPGWPPGVEDSADGGCVLVNGSSLANLRRRCSLRRVVLLQLGQSERGRGAGEWLPVKVRVALTRSGLSTAEAMTSNSTGRKGIGSRGVGETRPRML